MIKCLWPLRKLEVGYVHASMDFDLTIRVCGTFVRTKGTAPASLRMFTITALRSAYFPIHDAYPGKRKIFQHSRRLPERNRLQTHDSFQSLNGDLILERYYIEVFSCDKVPRPLTVLPGNPCRGPTTLPVFFKYSSSSAARARARLTNISVKQLV